jgi:hypothetical protein
MFAFVRYHGNAIMLRLGQLLNITHVGGSQITPHADGCSERVVRVAGGGGGVAVIAAGVALAAGLLTVFSQSASFTLSVDMVTGLPCTRSPSVLSFRDRTWYGPL